MMEFQREKRYLQRIAAVTDETQYIKDLSGNLIPIEPSTNVIAKHADLQWCVEKRAWRAAVVAKAAAEPPPMVWKSSPTGCGVAHARE